MAVQKRNTTAAPTGASQPQAARTSTAGSAPAGQTYASLNPDDFVQGGLIDDVDVTFLSCRFVEWDYNGTIDTPALALLVSMTYDDNGDVKEVNQYYSAGDLRRFQPSEDGTHAVSVSGAKGLATGTNIAFLLKSLKDAGFPMDRFGDGDMSVLDGLFCHINRIPQGERKGLKRNQTDDKGFEKTVAVVTKIHRMPWEKPGTKTATAAVAKPTAINAKTVAGKAQSPAPVEASNGAGELEDATDPMVQMAAGLLIETLIAKGGSVKKTGLAPASFKVLSGYPAERSQILGLFAKDSFLNLGGIEGIGTWDYDDVTVTNPQPS
jgi:hypothetical protein